jgi:hypothetical protein
MSVTITRTNVAQHYRTITSNNPPPANFLLEGEISVEMNTPIRIWMGCPVSLDPTGRVCIFDWSQVGFPEAPATGLTYGRIGTTHTWSEVPQEAPTDGRTYARQGSTQSWLPIAIGTATITVSDTPPSLPVPGALWWDSQELNAYVYYNDGTSSQWTALIPFTGILDSPSDGTVYGRSDSEWVNVLPLSGGSNAAMTGMLYMGGNRVTGIGTPQAINDATNKGYVDTSVANALTTVAGNYLPLTGGSLAGPGNLIVGGLLSVTGNVICANAIYGANGHYVGTTGSAFGLYNSGGNPTLDFAANNYLQYAGGNLNYYSTGQHMFTGSVRSNYNSSSGTSGLMAVSATNGGTAQIQLTSLGYINFFIRCYTNGWLEWINSGYNAVIMAMDNNGNLTVNNLYRGIESYGTQVVWNDGGTYSINVTGNAGSVSNGVYNNGGAYNIVAYCNVSGHAGYFNWSGQGGQPSWLWGGNDGTNMYVWNPSNFSVNYANSAGTASYANNAGGNFTVGGGISINGAVGTLSSSGNTYGAGGTGSGSWTVGAAINTGSWYVGPGLATVSDRRLKSNIIDLTEDDAEAWIRAARPRRYLKEGKPSAGFIAQEELKTCREEAVMCFPDDGDLFAAPDGDIPAHVRLSRDYDMDIAYLTKALQAALNRLDVLEAKTAEYGII